MCYARNMSDRKLNNYCVNLMSINVKLMSNFHTFVPKYILKCMYICICGRNNGLSEQWAVGIMGCRNNGSSELWAVGIMTRNPFTVPCE